MDYYIETSSPYSEQEAYLAIPFSNADDFLMSGSGHAGSFRLHSRTQGEFGPNEKTSTTIIEQFSVSPHVGANIGPGGQIGVGTHSLQVGKWVQPKPFPQTHPSN